MNINDELIQYALNTNLICAEEFQQQLQSIERKYYLSMHQHKIWRGSDGRYCTYLRRPEEKKSRKLIKYTHLEDLEAAVIQFYKSQPENSISVDDVYNDWIKEKQTSGEVKKQTIDRYRLDYKRFLANTVLSKKPIAAVNANELKKFIKAEIISKELSSKGWSNLRLLLFGIFTYAAEKDYICLDIRKVVNNMSLSRAIFRKTNRVSADSVFTADEIKAIRYYIAGREPSAINQCILLSIVTGMRVGELVALKINDIDFSRRVVNVRRTEVRYKDETGKYTFDIEESTKGIAGNRCVIITPEGLDIIRAAWETGEHKDDYIFTSDLTGERIHGSYCTMKLRNICTRLGIQRRSMHKIRKTYATQLINSGASESLVMRQLGHTSITTTLRHYYYDNTTDIDAHKQVEKAIAY